MVTRSRIISIAFIAAGVFTGLTFNDTLVILFRKLNELYDEVFYPDIKVDNVYTQEELAKYNGETRPLLYIAFTGTIFDVTRASKHYGKGAPYNYFVGKDGTRAFITGNFNDESDNKDHVLDMTCDELLGLANWKKTIKEKYGIVGILVGRYYDKVGRETAYHAQVLDRVGHCLVEREILKEEERQFPPCNSSWDAEKGTRVWCTKSSGGIKRDWIGVPRMMYSPGSTKPRCVCVNETTKLPTGMFQEYNNCSNTSASCQVEPNDSS